MPIIFEDQIMTEQNLENVVEHEDTHLNKSVETTTLDDYLVYPTTPVRKGKRQSEKLPYVLTSSVWKQLQLEKKEKKKKNC